MMGYLRTCVRKYQLGLFFENPSTSITYTRQCIGHVTIWKLNTNGRSYFPQPFLYTGNLVFQFYECTFVNTTVSPSTHPLTDLLSHACVEEYAMFRIYTNARSYLCNHYFSDTCLLSFSLGYWISCIPVSLL